MHENTTFIARMIFDTHTHSYFPDLAHKQDEIIAHMKEYNVRYATQIGCDIETSQKAVALAEAYEPYFATIGYHPTDGQNLTKDMIPQVTKELETLLMDKRSYIIAIGEIGFDYFHLEEGTIDEQKEVQKILFFAMTDLAKKHDLPVIIHTRNAREDTLRYIKESGIRKAIIHCFSEDYAFAQELMQYSDEIVFSFSWIVTYKKSLEVQEAARLIPLGKILVETDAPFLSPQPVRGQVNESAHVRFTLDAIKNLRDEASEEVEDVIFANSLRVYGIKARMY